MENMVELDLKNNSIEYVDLQYVHRKALKELAKLSGKRVLLIGAGGFLGYYFIKSFMAWNEKHSKKINFTALSRFSLGIPDWLKALQKKSDIRILQQDISKYKLPTRDRYDYIIHAASFASPIYYRKHPVKTINATVQGLYNVLDYMLVRKNTRHSVKGLLFFSSSEIYGDPTKDNIPTKETYRGFVSCTGPRSCYDESKRFCETLCVNYSKVYSLPIHVARPFNNYGPGMKINDGRVIADFAKNVVAGRDIVMFSDGKPSRTFCYVADAIVGYLKVLTKGKNGEAYNIGIEKPEISMKNLALLIKSIAKKEFNYNGRVITKKSGDKNYLVDNPSRRCPNIEKAKRELEYNPEITLKEGLFRTLCWYMQPANNK